MTERTANMSIAALIPTYNRRTQTVRAVESVLAQTVTVDEIIVVDDGSTDGTAEFLTATFGERVTVIRQQNGGVSAARTRAVEAARSQWVAFLDSDDVWLPRKLEAQCAALQALGSDFGACATNCAYTGDDTKQLTVFEEAGMPVHPEFGPIDHPEKFIIGELGIFVQGMLVLRSLILDVGGFDESLGISEDRDLVLKLTGRTRFCFVAEPLVRIDRSSDLPRLTGRLNHKTDESYTCMEVLLQRMLTRAKLGDAIYATIRESLLDLYYAWASERIGALRLRVAGRVIRRIHALGLGYPAIASTLTVRAARKVKRSLLPAFTAL
jgi:glycosyltransferase involved in cell wall biosynthesis